MEDLETVLSPVLDAVNQGNELLVVFVALFGVVVGALLALILFRRF